MNGLQPLADCLKDALKRLPIYEGPVFRISKDLPENIDREHLAGITVLYQAFTSISARPDFFEVLKLDEGSQDMFSAHHLQFYIISRKGRDISKYSINNIEREILFLPQSCFEINERLEHDNWNEI